MSEPTAHQRLTRAGLSAAFADLVLERHDREVAEQAEAEQRLARVRSACDQLERAVINADGRLLTAYDRGVDTAIRRIRNALDRPAHDAGDADPDGRYVACGRCTGMPLIPASRWQRHLGNKHQPAHDGGPTVQEATADDRRWPLEKAGE